jgi:hypothetical protein
MFFVGNSIDVALGFLGRRDGDGNIILSVYIYFLQWMSWRVCRVQSAPFVICIRLCLSGVLFGTA